MYENLYRKQRTARGRVSASVRQLREPCASGAQHSTSSQISTRKFEKSALTMVEPNQTTLARCPGGQQEGGDDADGEGTATMPHCQCHSHTATLLHDQIITLPQCQTVTLSHC